MQLVFDESHPCDDGCRGPLDITGAEETAGHRRHMEASGAAIMAVQICRS
jgi:hypothetical protein